jgi:riboflavin biosynthesis pyrimidine reductase
VFVTEGLRVDLKKAIIQLGNLGVKELLVEGGGTLNEELLKLNLINEINIYIAPLIFGGSSAPTFASSDGFEREYAKQLKLDSIQQYDDGGLVLRYIF